MNKISRTTTNKADAIPADLLRLADSIRKLPDVHRLSIEPALTRVLESTKRRRRILTLVQEALSQLRLDMKYLMFDLEATRRERDDYRSRIEGEQS